MKDGTYTRFREELELRGFSPVSIETYIRLVKSCSNHFLRSPDKITDEELREYLLHLLKKKKYKRSTMIGVTSALRAYYRIILHRSEDSLKDLLPRMKSAAKLPQVYSTEEIGRLLTVKGLRMKQRAMLITAYSAGLGVSEVCKLKPGDILSGRMQIRIEQGKGWKDRYTVLSPKLLNILRNYWRRYRPGIWLFPNPVNFKKHINSRSLQRAFKQAVRLAELPYRGGIHSLRHSFATHAYESGINLPTLQSLLGHRWLSSTMIYIHVSEQRFSQARSSLDIIDINTIPPSNDCQSEAI